MSDITLDEQEPTAVDFVTGLVDAFGFEAEITAESDEDGDAIEIHVEGEDLGLFVGQRGTTLVGHRGADPYRRRTAALGPARGPPPGRCRRLPGPSQGGADPLRRPDRRPGDRHRLESVALEPMSPPDRKIVHDAVNEIDGVHTASRGEDRRRHVVILPDDDE